MSSRLPKESCNHVFVAILPHEKIYVFAFVLYVYMYVYVQVSIRICI